MGSGSSKDTTTVYCIEKNISKQRRERPWKGWERPWERGRRLFPIDRSMKLGSSRVHATANVRKKAEWHRSNTAMRQGTFFHTVLYPHTHKHTQASAACPEEPLRRHIATPCKAPQETRAHSPHPIRAYCKGHKHTVSDRSRQRERRHI